MTRTHNAIVRRTDLLRMRVELFMLAVEHATPGPWDVFDGMVSAPEVPCEQSRFARDEDSSTYEYYGGDLICESVARANAVLIAAARDLDALRWDEFYQNHAYRLETENHELRADHRRLVDNYNRLAALHAEESSRAHALVLAKDEEIQRLHETICELRDGAIR